MVEQNFEAHTTGAMRQNMREVYDLFPIEGLKAYCRVAEFGANKYAPWNWARGLPQTQIAASLTRHLSAYLRGEENDQDSGLSHIDHVVWNAVALAHHREHGLCDTRRPDPYTFNKPTAMVATDEKFGGGPIPPQGGPVSNEPKVKKPMIMLDLGGDLDHAMIAELEALFDKQDHHVGQPEPEDEAVDQPKVNKTPILVKTGEDFVEVDDTDEAFELLKEIVGSFMGPILDQATQDEANRQPNVEQSDLIKTLQNNSEEIVGSIKGSMLDQSAQAEAEKPSATVQIGNETMELDDLMNKIAIENLNCFVREIYGNRARMTRYPWFTESEVLAFVTKTIDRLGQPFADLFITGLEKSVERVKPLSHQKFDRHDLSACEAFLVAIRKHIPKTA